MKAPAGQLAVAAAVVALGAGVLWGSFNLPTGGGYAQVGPGVVPRLVGIGLLLLGVALGVEALRGGFRGLDEEGERALGMHWPAFALITGGIIAYGFMIQPAGFVIASMALFVLVASAFGSRRWLLNAIVGLVLAAVIFAIFNYGLGLTLPAGALRPLLPA